MPEYNASGWSYYDTAPMMWTVSSSNKKINNIGRGNLYINPNYINRIRLHLTGLVSLDFVDGRKMVENHEISMIRILI